MRRFAAILYWSLIGFVSLPGVAGAEIRVFLDDENYFVMEGSGVELLGIQFESVSGSLIPADSSLTGPFDLSLMNTPRVVMFGSLGSVATIDGAIRLPTQWDPSGQQDVGFLWGSPTDQGVGAVDGHIAEFISKRAGINVSDEPVVAVPAPVASDIQIDDFQTGDALDSPLQADELFFAAQEFNPGTTTLLPEPDGRIVCLIAMFGFVSLLRRNECKRKA